ncbi:MAG TPA: epoxyqueuosine reductase QueH [Acetivibrio sp.]|uniref:epoxyqueuosine reductase QueH n=1 Tax=Acetivibrio sp. TaxID=1872092 RepID=UPI002C9C3710|nr:epoxyqueuosine reductase QueH [Acetivibrio sp.]HOM01968.1 epoxyqueuosine reductase QueH [Acetivibrio sp.]
MRLLLHICCGPCAVYPVSVLEEEGVDFEGLFYNPNIHPYDEFVRRKENVGEFAKIKNFSVKYMDDFSQDIWEKLGEDNENRCNMCYTVRIDKVAQFAKENGFDAFTTTLLVSPYQKHELIVELSEKAAQKYGLTFYYKDFRPGFRQGQQWAKELGLYRQKYCGCIISYRESEKLKNERKKSK